MLEKADGVGREQTGTAEPGAGTAAAHAFAQHSAAAQAAAAGPPAPANASADQDLTNRLARKLLRGIELSGIPKSVSAAEVAKSIADAVATQTDRLVDEVAHAPERFRALERNAALDLATRASTPELGIVPERNFLVALNGGLERGTFGTALRAAQVLADAQLLVSKGVVPKDGFFEALSFRLEQASAELSPGNAEALRSLVLHSDAVAFQAGGSAELAAHYPADRALIDARLAALQKDPKAPVADREALTRALADTYVVEHGKTVPLSFRTLEQDVAEALGGEINRGVRAIANSVVNFALDVGEREMKGATLTALPLVVDDGSNRGPQLYVMWQITLASGDHAYFDSDGRVYRSHDEFWTDNKPPYGRISIPEGGKLTLDAGHVKLASRLKTESGWHKAWGWTELALLATGAIAVAAQPELLLPVALGGGGLIVSEDVMALHDRAAHYQSWGLNWETLPTYLSMGTAVLTVGAAGTAARLAKAVIAEAAETGEVAISPQIARMASQLNTAARLSTRAGAGYSAGVLAAKWQDLSPEERLRAVLPGLLAAVVGTAAATVSVSPKVASISKTGGYKTYMVTWMRRGQVLRVMLGHNPLNKSLGPHDFEVLRTRGTGTYSENWDALRSPEGQQALTEAVHQINGKPVGAVHMPWSSR